MVGAAGNSQLNGQVQDRVRCSHDVDDIFDQTDDLCLRDCSLEDEAEFVTGDIVNISELIEFLFEFFCDLCEILVTEIIAVGIIDTAEVIEVKDRNIELFGCKTLADILFQRITVLQTGQNVGNSNIFHLFAGTHQTAGSIRELCG